MNCNIVLYFLHQYCQSSSVLPVFIRIASLPQYCQSSSVLPVFLSIASLPQYCQSSSVVSVFLVSASRLTFSLSSSVPTLFHNTPQYYQSSLIEQPIFLSTVFLLLRTSSLPQYCQSSPVLPIFLNATSPYHH